MNARWTAAIAGAAAVLATLAPAPSAGAATGVLVVGDSLEVGTSPYLGHFLPGVRLTVDAQESRSSATAAGIVSQRLKPDDSVVVFDAGVNDDPGQPDALAGDLAQVSSAIGNRCLVLATVSRPPYNGVTDAGLNAAIRDFAAQRPNTQVVDWRSAAHAHPELIYSDGVHPSAAGYQLRAQLIAGGVQACLSSSTAPLPTVPAPTTTVPPALYAPTVNPALKRQRSIATAARLTAGKYANRAGQLLFGGPVAMLLFTVAALGPPPAVLGPPPTPPARPESRQRSRLRASR